MNSARKTQRIQWLQILDKYRTDNESNRSFAKRIGLNHGIITSWEKGDTPKISIVNQIRDKLQLSDEDYSDIMWLTNRVLVAASTLTRKKIEQELLDAERIPNDHVCALLLAKKPKNKSAQRYILSLGFSIDRWIELARDADPKLTMEEIYRLRIRRSGVRISSGAPRKTAGYVKKRSLFLFLGHKKYQFYTQ